MTKKKRKGSKKPKRRFHAWLTDWDDYCNYKGKARKHQNESDFWKYRLDELAKYKNETSPRVHIDLMWKYAGRPYYNIHPRLAPKFCKVNLSKIPSHLVEMPIGLDVVNMRFCEPMKELTTQCEIINTGCKEWETEAGSLPKGEWVHNFMILKPTLKMLGHVHPQLSADQLSMIFPDNKVIMLAIDLNVINVHGIRMHLFAPMAITSHMTIEESIAQTCALTTDRHDEFQRIISNCCRVAVTVGFLANANDEMIEPDVIPKLKDRYKNATPNEKEIIERQSRNAGIHGYNIGNDIMFLGQQPVQSRRGVGGTGQELKWQHLRDGHPHAVRYGKGNKLVKVMWFRPTRVRKDLPFKPED